MTEGWRDSEEEIMIRREGRDCGRAKERGTEGGTRRVVGRERDRVNKLESEHRDMLWNDLGLILAVLAITSTSIPQMKTPGSECCTLIGDRPCQHCEGLISPQSRFRVSSLI